MFEANRPRGLSLQMARGEMHVTEEELVETRRRSEMNRDGDLRREEPQLVSGNNARRVSEESFKKDAEAMEERRSREARPCEDEGETKTNGFENHGLRRWEEGRANWRQARMGWYNRRTPPTVDDEVIYDTIFSKPMGWLLPHPVPLAHMVELLEDEWSD